MTVLDKNLKKNENSVCSESVVAEAGKGFQKEPIGETDELLENQCRSGLML